MSKKGKLVIIGTGGCGINVLHECSNALKETVLSQADSEFLFVDTSNANEHRVKEIGGTLSRISSTSASKGEIVGSGGERSTNVDDIKEGVKSFLDENNIVKAVPGEFYVVVSSLSGGSGSLLAPLLVQQLHMKGIPVISVAVGDSKDAISNTNTTRTLQTYSSIAKGLKKPLSMFFVDNSDYEGTEYDRINEVNKIIETFLVTLAIFCSGKNEGMDFSDMQTFFDPGRYKTIDVPTGISFIRALSKTVDTAFASTVNISRAVTDGRTDVQLSSQHDKSCVMLDKESLNKFSTALPLVVTSTSGYLKYILDILEDRTIQFEEKQKAIEDDSHLNFDDADDDGLVI